MLSIPQSLPAQPSPFDDEIEALPAEWMPAVTGRMVPRPYQTLAVEESNKAWFDEGLRKILAVMPTGAGKTVFFSILIDEFVKRGQRVLVMAHTDRLLLQAADKLLEVSGLVAAREKAAERAYITDSVVVSSTQTLGKKARLERWPRDHFALVIYDECHRIMNPSNMLIAEHFEPAKILGVTATPTRSDGKQLGRFFEKRVINYGIMEAVIDGWLVRPIAKTIPLKVDMRSIKMKKGPDGTELDKEEVARRLEPFLDEVAAKLIEHAGNRKTLVFLPTVDSSIKLAEKINAHGGVADFVCSDEDRCIDRRGSEGRFERGETQFMCNAMLYTEGVDDPGISCVCVLRITESLGLVTQAWGRGTRSVIPKMLNTLATPEERRDAIAASAKPDMLILDFLWLTDSHNIMHPAHFLACSDEVTKEMLKKPEGDLLDIQEKADRDSLAAVAKEAAKHKNKTARTFDLVKTAVTLHDDDLKNYRPVTSLDRMPPSKEQIKILEDLGVDTSKIDSTGLASKWIAMADKRKQSGLCSFRQMDYLDRLGIKDVAMITSGKAGFLINGGMKHQKKKADVLSKKDYLWVKDYDDTHLVLAASDDFAVCSMPFGKDGVKFCIIDWKNKMRAPALDSGTLIPFDFSREEDCRMAVQGLTRGLLKMPGDAVALNLHRVQKGGR